MGLTNMGATCYMNSLVQLLYFNPIIRRGVFQLSPEILPPSHPVAHLQRIFTHLAIGKQR